MKIRFCIDHKDGFAENVVGIAFSTKIIIIIIANQSYKVNKMGSLLYTAEPSDLQQPVELTFENQIE